MKKITGRKAGYKDKMQSFLNHDSKKAWQGLQIITGFKPKTHTMNVANDSVFVTDLNCFYCRYDTVDNAPQQAEAVDKVTSLPVSDIRITLDEVKKPFLHINTCKSQGWHWL